MPSLKLHLYLYFLLLIHETGGKKVLDLRNTVELHIDESVDHARVWNERHMAIHSKTRELSAGKHLGFGHQEYVLERLPISLSMPVQRGHQGGDEIIFEVPPSSSGRGEHVLGVIEDVYPGYNGTYSFAGKIAPLAHHNSFKGEGWFSLAVSAAGNHVRGLINFKDAEHHYELIKVFPCI